MPWINSDQARVANNSLRNARINPAYAVATGGMYDSVYVIMQNSRKTMSTHAAGYSVFTYTLYCNINFL